MPTTPTLPTQMPDHPDDERARRAWLERALPHHPDVVAQEVHDVVQETAARVLANLPAPSVDPPSTAPVRGEAP